ncbi:MAG: metalloregulator ArsR/SmtB family transcription factor [Crocinitomicaceae bacterium]|nr:metalloregulator ArsR/SmtB family transcription factor [Crocinitomicaceae bacterium]
MGATKYEVYPTELIDAVDLLKAISHPARLQIVQMISESKEKEVSTSEILEAIQLSQSTISVHLKVLHNAGIINSRMMKQRNNRTILSYGLNIEALKMLEQCLDYLVIRFDVDAKKLHVLYNVFSRYKENTPLKTFFST